MFVNNPSYLSQIIDALESQFGIPQFQPEQHDVLGNLILTVLSQSTNDRNRDHAFQLLKNKFPSYEALLNADDSDIAETIKSAGLYRQKSKRIKSILMWIIKEFGSFNIDEICSWPTELVFKKFLPLQGIGVKSIAVILLFKCGRDIFPVDTHVHRITRRLGLVPENYSAEKVFYTLDPLIPKGKSYSFHINLLKLGRQICKARKPRHTECSLLKWCPSADNPYL